MVDNYNSADYKNFRGQVKISDIQEEFNKLLDRINNMIDSYNVGADTGSSINYNIGNPDLAPINYTLSVGGLKRVLKNYDGVISGCQVFRRSGNSFRVTDGLLITSEGPIKIPSSIITGTGRYLWFNKTSKALNISDTQPSADYVKITKLNTNRPSKLCNTSEFTAEEIPGFKIKSGTTAYNFNNNDWAGNSTKTTWSPAYMDPNNSKKGSFIAGMPAVAETGQTILYNLLGRYVGGCWASGSAGRRRTYWAPLSRLFLPKGIPFPYSGNCKSVTFDVIQTGKQGYNQI